MPALRNGAFLCRESGTHFVRCIDAIGGSFVLAHHMVEEISIRFGIFSAAGGLATELQPFGIASVETRRPPALPPGLR